MYRLSTGIEYVHRIVGMTEDEKYEFKSDNNSTPDFNPVPIENIEGKIICKINIIAPVIRSLKQLDDE